MIGYDGRDLFVRFCRVLMVSLALKVRQERQVERGRLGLQALREWQENLDHK